MDNHRKERYEADTTGSIARRSCDRVRLAYPLLALVLVFAESSAGAGPQRALRVDSPDWSSPTLLSREKVITLDEPGVIVDDFGNTTAVWIGTRNDYFDQRGLVVRRKPAGSAWQPERLLDGYAAEPFDIEADPSGNVTIVYGYTRSSYAYLNSSPYAITANPSGVFGEPVQLSADVYERDLQLGIAPDGTATAAWISRLDDHGKRVAVVQRPPGADWGPVRYITPRESLAFELKIDVGTGGDVTALWTGRLMHRHSYKRTVHARTLSDGQWSKTTILTHGQMTYARDMQVATGPRGTALASWVYSRNADTDLAVTAIRDADGTWAPPAELGPVEYEGAKVAATGNRKVVVWTDPGPNTGPDYLFARIHQGGSWGKLVLLSDPQGEPDLGEVESDGDGGVRVVWTFGRPARGPFEEAGDNRVQTRRLGKDGNWSPVQTISEEGVYYFSLALSAGSNGHAAIVWKQKDGGTVDGRVAHAGTI